MDMRQGVMGQWEQRAHGRCMQSPSSTPMPAMCQLAAGCADSKEVNQAESLLTQWGRQMCSLQGNPGVMVLQWPEGSTWGRLHGGGGI